MGMKAALMVMLAAAVACGGKAAPDQGGKPAELGQDGTKHDKGQEMGREMGEMAAMPPSIAKFHETLAPRWHAPQGPQRMADACAAIGQLHADAGAIVAAPPPAGATPGSWSATGQQLAEAVTALEATCKAGDATAFEPAFMRVHTSFHHAMEAAMPKHGDHDEHGEHGEHEHKM
jgi:hypothetical protein